MNLDCRFVVSARKAWMIVLAGALCVMACGDGKNEDPSGQGGASPAPVEGRPVSQSGYASTAADAICDGLPKCCQKVGRSYNDQSCRTAALGILQLQLNAAMARGQTYDAQAAGNCVALLRQQVGICGDGPKVTNDVCDRIFVGTKKPGEACQTNSDCQPVGSDDVRCTHWFSLTPPGGAGAICQLVKKAKLGEECTTATTPPAAMEALCDEDADLTCQQGRCKALPIEGQPCDGKCAKDLACRAGTCRARAAIGAPCDGENLAQPQCVAGAYCDVFGGGRCTAKKTDQAACMGSYECITNRCEGMKCMPDAAKDKSDDNGLALFCGG